MKLGIVDLGTNSLRFDIYSISSRGNAKLLYHEKDMIRLGQDVFLKQRLSSKSVKKTLHRLSHISKLAKKYKIDKMVCNGTSPLREAKDAQVLIKKIYKTTGFKFSVITGSKEAKLIGNALAYFHKPRKKTVFIDIGGGSTEVSICHQNKLIQSKSMKLGSMRLQHQFLRQVPPSTKSIQKLKQTIQATLKKSFPRKPKVLAALGSAGTIKALLKVAGSSQKTLYKKDLETFFDKISSLKLTSLKSILKTEGRRGDILLAGTILLLEIMNFFGLQSITVTKRGLRDGILLEQIQNEQAS